MKLWIRWLLPIGIFGAISAYGYIQKIPKRSQIPESIKAELRMLRKNEDHLEKELLELRRERRVSSVNDIDQDMPPPVSSYSPTSVRNAQGYFEPPLERAEEIGQSKESQAQQQAEKELLGAAPYGYYGALRFRRGITVTTSPLLGLRSAFDASDLLYQYPSMNEDLIILRQRQYFEDHLRYVGDTLADRAIIVLSGALEGQIIYNRDFTGFSNGDINLTTAELDFISMLSTWANGFVSLDYDSAPPATGSRVTNSRIYLSRGFLTIGNLEVSPLYLTIGQYYPPFGRYSTLMLTTPLTKSLARIEARSALIGYYKSGFYGELYGFQGFRRTGVRYTFRQGGLNMGYQAYSFDFGAGYVTNMADSQGMQSNGINPIVTSFITGNISQLTLSQFGGFGDTPGGNNLVHNVPGVDAHMEFNKGPVSLITEFITATQHFAPQDMTFNGNPADVKAMHLEIDYNINVHNKPISFGLIYGQSWESLALNLPKNSYIAVISTSIWKNTMMGIEYRHDDNYGATALSSVTGAGLPVPPANIGGTRNLVTLQFGAYF